MIRTIFEAVEKGIAFIESNLTNEIGVADVADAVSYSQFYFSREFSRYTHTSVYDYILRRKVSEAYKCLFETAPKIVDLAFSFGFQSHEVFTRAFRKMFGENPSEVRDYKPLAVYEAIDGDYLDFLFGLKAEYIAGAAGEFVVELEARTDARHGSCSLLLLDKTNLFSCTDILRGTRVPGETGALSFRLHHLKHAVRLSKTEEKKASRYFFDNFYDAGDMGGNYVMAVTEAASIDFYIPQK